MSRARCNARSSVVTARFAQGGPSSRGLEQSAGLGRFLGSGSCAGEAVGVGAGLDDGAVEREPVDDGRAEPAPYPSRWSWTVLRLPRRPVPPAFLCASPVPFSFGRIVTGGTHHQARSRTIATAITPRGSCPVPKRAHGGCGWCLGQVSRAAYENRLNGRLCSAAAPCRRGRLVAGRRGRGPPLPGRLLPVGLLDGDSAEEGRLAFGQPGAVRWVRGVCMSAYRWFSASGT